MGKGLKIEHIGEDGTHFDREGKIKFTDIIEQYLTEKITNKEKRTETAIPQSKDRKVKKVNLIKAPTQGKMEKKH